MSHYLNENNCRLTNNFEGKGLKHYGCELFSAIVHKRKLRKYLVGVPRDTTVLKKVYPTSGGSTLPRKESGTYNNEQSVSSVKCDTDLQMLMHDSDGIKVLKKTDCTSLS